MSVSTSQTPTLNIAGRLVVNGRSLRVGQICGQTLVLMDACQLPPGDAELIVTVLGQEKVYRIFTATTDIRTWCRTSEVRF